MSRLPAVRATAEFKRVRDLPRRIPSRTDAAAWARVFTDELRLPHGTQELRPWQGYSLAEVIDTENKPIEGAWLALPVGIGKTLITWLLPTLLGSQRPALIVPAALRDKTYEDFRELRKHWRAPPVPYRVFSREELQTEANQFLLREYEPDLIVPDESDDLSNPRAATVARIDRYVVEARGAGDKVVVVPLTGTPGRKSILNFWHQLFWALGDGAPVPGTSAEAKTWALALDLRTGAPAMRPGPLGSTYDKAGKWWQRRLRETPGVVIVDEDSCDKPLVIKQVLAREDVELDKHFEHFLKTNENPGGIPVTDPLSRWALDGVLGCGLYSYWDPAPPEEWRQANRAYARFVRTEVANSARSAQPLDTAGQVSSAFKGHPIIEQWHEIKPTFEGVTRTVWVTDSAMQSAIDWLHSSATPGILWTGSVPFGVALAKRARLPYYGRGGKTSGGQGLHNATRGQSLVCSWGANKKGFNLQDWSRQMIAHPPQSAKLLEQIIGRSHRSGAKQTVEIFFLITSGGTLDLFEKAIEEARWNKNRVSLTQKILRARIVRVTPNVNESNKYRWARKGGLETE